MHSLRRLAALVFAFSMVAAACSSDDAAETSTETTVASDATTETTMADTAAAETVVDIAVANPDFSILVQALTTAGLVETLSGEGPFTVFAPTDAAFEALLAELGITAEELLAREDLADILTYHVVPGTVMAADVMGMNGQTAATVNGAEITITVDGESVMVNDANVTATDIVGSNGVIHVIDSVLIPG